jgi:uncharacterized protein
VHGPSTDDVARNTSQNGQAGPSDPQARDACVPNPEDNRRAPDPPRSGAFSQEHKMSSKLPITNCHIHTFTMNHVPRNFLRFGLTGTLRHLPFRSAVARLLRGINPFDDRDRFSRYASFLEMGNCETQAEIFAQITGYYPPETRFVILPMDMAHMGAGEPREDIDAQHRALVRLALANPDTALPFLAVDPRRYPPEARPPLWEVLRRWFDENTHADGSRVFRGIKLYPPQGFDPNDARLNDLWEFCNERRIPVMTHCARSGVLARDIPADELVRYTDPDNYRSLLTRYPDVPLCLAHFGGLQDWDMYFERPESRREEPLDAPAKAREGMNWLTKILQMLRSGAPPNLYTDISYTVFRIEKYLPTLTVILRADAAIRNRTLFGSDFYMTQQEAFDERFLAMRLRASLGEELFDLIARENPHAYLGLPRQDGAGEAAPPLA